jgi:hypothetical protein
MANRKRGTQACKAVESGAEGSAHILGPDDFQEYEPVQRKVPWRHANGEAAIMVLTFRGFGDHLSIVGGDQLPA